MKKQLFDELVSSIREAGKIHRGEAEPSRRFVFEPEGVREIRAKLHKSQSELRSPVTAKQAEELERRLAAHESNPGEGASWEEIRDRLRKGR